MNRTLYFFIALAVFRLTAQDTSQCAQGMHEVLAGDYLHAQRSLWDCLASAASTGTQAQSATFYLTLTYRELKNYDAGLGKAEAALKQSPEDVDLLYLTAYLHYRRNQLKESMLLLSKAYRMEPNDWRIHQLFALNYIAFSMPDAVELELTKAISLNTSNAELHYQLARLYFSEEHYQKSIEEINRALAISPDYAKAYESLGLSYEALQDDKRAEENYRKAIDLDRKYRIKDEWPLIDYGSMLLRDDSPQASLPYLLAAVEINPSSPKGNYQAARAMRLLNRRIEAEKYFQRTIEADPTYTYAYYQLATLARERGDEERAAAMMQKYKLLIDNEAGNGTYNPSASAHMAR
jgi:tetratricopeptide (TPR) repeat protein